MHTKRVAPAHALAMTHPYPIHSCDMTPSSACHEFFIYV